MIYSSPNIDKTKADILIKLLSVILYFTLNTKEYMIDVKDEMIYIKKYIEIERIKYNNYFYVEWNICDTVNELKTLKFMLQPIVENAFEHGIRNKPGEKTLYILAQKTKKELIFTVSDNGSGITPKKLREIRTLLKSDEISENEHIGINNFNKRIQLIFGNAYGVKIQSSDTGTTVTISIPIIEKGG
jgi:two-component system sensor histidine kinase YesM